MSKHNKPYHNYNNYSANKPEVKVEEPVVEVTEVEEPVEIEAVVEPCSAAGLRADIPPVDEAGLVDEPIVETTELAMGVVNCKVLRMRNSTDTSTNDNVIYELPEGTEVRVNEAESTAEFYKVITTAGAEGFCMKKFITIK